MAVAGVWRGSDQTVHRTRRADRLDFASERKIGRCSFAICDRVGGRFYLSFNISPLQFQDAQFPQQLEAIAVEAGFPLSRIQLELTESAVIDDLARARLIASKLKALGIQIALDDFGTGFSSLRWLQALPFDAIKIDASFVRSMTTVRDSRKIVSAVIGLGQSLKMPVVAEGVETKAEASMLTKFGCDFVQGYLFSKPLMASAVPNILAARGELTTKIVPTDLSCNLRLAQLNAIYDCAPIALCFIDMSRRVVSANKKMADLVGGFDLTQIIGKRIDDVYPEFVPLIADLLDAVADGIDLSPLESRMPERNRWMLTTVSTVHDEDAELLGISIAIVDITDSKVSPPMRTFGKRPLPSNWRGKP
ncbi:MAG: hypothetical protein DI537_22170 [Stutzerimonas stutzeri]|nr:MAG: hypothetical protein DI537_22170 [Stutzerimonas stutzeri]